LVNVVRRRRSAAKLLSENDARRVAKIAELLELLGSWPLSVAITHVDEFYYGEADPKRTLGRL